MEQRLSYRLYLGQATSNLARFARVQSLVHGIVGVRMRIYIYIYTRARERRTSLRRKRVRLDTEEESFVARF